MYEARQNKEKVSRRIEGGRHTQQIALKSNDRMKSLQLMSFQNDYIKYKSELDNLGRAKKIVARIEKNAIGSIDGGAPSAYPVGWEYLQRKNGSLRGQWVRFHILNQNLGGPGNDPGNLIPTTHAMNHDVLWRDFEESCKADNKHESFIFNAEIPAYYTVPVEKEDQGFPKAIDANLYAEDGTLLDCFYCKIPLPPDLTSCDVTDLMNEHPDISTMQIPDKKDYDYRNLSRKKKTPFSTEEDKILIALVKNVGVDNLGKYVSHFLPNRSLAECKQRWNRHLNPDISKERWEASEDERLLTLVNSYGTKAWQKVSGSMGNRTDVQCRYRYQLLKNR